MMVVDREIFIAASQGYSIIRDHDKLLIIDEQKIDDVNEILNKGEVVYLTIGNKVVSKIQKINNAFVELE